MKSRIVRSFALALLLLGLSAMGVEVEVEGKAAGDLPHAREEALADALREAVRVGAGVDVLSTTAVKDFQLEFDRVLSAAFGHVKNYRVLGSSLGVDGIYRITVKAEVGAGTPGMNEELALRQIVLLKQSPRVGLRITEQIEGVPEGKGYAAGWFEAVAQKFRLQVVDIGATRAAEGLRAERDAALGNEQGAKMRRAGIAQKVDFVIEGKVNGRYAGVEALFGSLPEHAFEIGGELRAVRPDTGEVVASVVVPASDKYRSGLQTKEMAAREVLHRVMEGGKGAKGTAVHQGGMALFMKIFARWMVEVDCGSVRQVEFEKISASDFAKVQSGLKSADKVSAVWQREFDAQAVSHLDVETRLTSLDLAAEIERASGGALALERSTDSYLLFKKGEVSAKPEVAVPKKGLLDRLLGR
jgi:hypothetical protein